MYSMKDHGHHHKKKKKKRHKVVVVNSWMWVKVSESTFSSRFWIASSYTITTSHLPSSSHSLSNWKDEQPVWNMNQEGTTHFLHFSYFSLYSICFMLPNAFSLQSSIHWKLYFTSPTVRIYSIASIALLPESPLYWNFVPWLQLWIHYVSLLPYNLTTTVGHMRS